MINNRPAAFCDDADLVAGVAARQPAALLELYDRYSRAAYALAARMLADAARAEDGTHAAFLEVWWHPPPAELAGVDFSAWLLAVVQRQAYAQQRAAAPWPASGATPPSNGMAHEAVGLPPEPPATPARIGARSLLAARQQRTSAALANLHAAERAVLERAYFDGMTTMEIAAALHEPLVTVQTQIQDGVLDLRAGLAAASRPDYPGTGHSAPALAWPDPMRDPPGTSIAAGSGIDEIGRLRRLDQQQDQLLVLVGHELKTPITVIKGTIQMAGRRLRKAGIRRRPRNWT